MPPGVEFDEWRPPKGAPEETKMVRWVIAHSGGLITSRNSANKALTVLAVLAFLLSLYFFSRA